MVKRIAPYGFVRCGRFWRNGGAHCALRFCHEFNRVRCPVGGVNSFFDESVKAGVWPIGESLHVTMFYRIDVYIVDVSG
jgi:hypothetical protein